MIAYKPWALRLPFPSPDLCSSAMSTDSTAPQPRVIVLCFDGTANQYDETVSRPSSCSAHADVQKHQNTNVVKFYALLDKSCPLEQIVYYQVRLRTKQAFASAQLKFAIAEHA